MSEKNVRDYYKPKNYLHFDRKRTYNYKTKSYVTDSISIRTHSFYPLIRYFSKTEKYDKDHLDSRPIKTKKRQIMYASHIDNFIYKYYGEQLNTRYNIWMKNHSIDINVTAYRSKEGERGKNNINYAADVISRIHHLESCYIIIGDFVKYFDYLDHQKLKDRLCRVLGFEKNNLPEDWFKVFQSVTKYSYYNQKRIHKYCGTERQLRQVKQYQYFSSPKDFRKFKSLYSPTKNINDYGIPQGTAISAVLSNVYAIDFDEQVTDLVHNYGGLYRRYSDDFIVVLPIDHMKDKEEFIKVKDTIYSFIDENGMKIEPNKTQVYCYQKKCMIDYYSSKPAKMDYLGFVYDGTSVEMRGKSPFKFYRHAKKTIEKAKKVQREKGLKKLPYRRQIYKLYSDLGIARRPHGNFLTYASNSQKIFDNISPYTNNQMLHQVNNRKKKINQMLGYRLTHK